MSLYLYGWKNEKYIKALKNVSPKIRPGRIISRARGKYTAVTETGEIKAELSGSFMYRAVDNLDYPVTGDFVMLRKEQDIHIIEQVLERQSLLKRKTPGGTSEEQGLAANIDKGFLVFGLDGGRSFSTGAIERLTTLVWDSGASPVILLNKTDLTDNLTRFMREAEIAAPGVPVYAVSAKNGVNLDSIRTVLKKGETGVFIGRSGVGKSALTNALMNRKVRSTGAVREDDRKGRHTTTNSELILLPWGALLIDSPGIREIQLTGDTKAVGDTFPEIEAAAMICRFRDCSHSTEPGCAVQLAIEEGTITEERFRSYQKYLNEIRYQQRRGDRRLEQLEKEKWKAIHKDYKKYGRKK